MWACLLESLRFKKPRPTISCAAQSDLDCLWWDTLNLLRVCWGNTSFFSYFQHLSGPSLLLLAPLLSEITSNRLLASGRLLCRMDKVLLSPRADLVTESSCSLLKAHQWLSNTRVAVIWEEPLFLAVPQSGSFKEERNQPRGSPNAVSGIFPSPLYACVCFSCTFEY